MKQLKKNLLISLAVCAAAVSLLGGCVSKQTADSMRAHIDDQNRKINSLQAENDNLKNENRKLKDEQSRAAEAEHFTQCKSNLKNIGTACEMFSTDNSGRYPRSLSELTPDYLRSIPTCPAAGYNTYSDSYVAASNPDSYTVYCQGHNHREVNEDYPQFNAWVGLVEDD